MHQLIWEASPGGPKWLRPRRRFKPENQGNLDYWDFWLKSPSSTRWQVSPGRGLPYESVPEPGEATELEIQKNRWAILEDFWRQSARAKDVGARGARIARARTFGAIAVRANDRAKRSEASDATTTPIQRQQRSHQQLNNNDDESTTSRLVV